MRERPQIPAAVVNEVAEKFSEAGSHPAHVFAIRQTAMILTDGNMYLFEPEDIQEWEDAIARWFDMHPDAPPVELLESDPKPPWTPDH